MQSEEPPAARLAPSVALMSIACFWAFYLTIWSLRSMALYHHDQTGMLGKRAVVSLFSAGVTVLFYLLMRRVAGARLRISVGLALMLAVPAALSYSAFNWYMFSHIGEGVAMSWHWTAPKAEDLPPLPPTPPAPPVVPGAPALSVGMMRNTSDEGMTPLQSIVDQAVNGYFFFIAWSALYLALSYAVRAAALERREAALRAAAQAAELKALRYQVNPHFLFNTLNALSSLILTGKREQAEQMIINLATFFRTSLTGDPTEDVPLSDEIMLQRLYLDIERVRFPDRLLVSMDVPEALLHACVPGLILQPLVENAVKYAVSRSRRPVTIRIAAREEGDRVTLRVEDDGDPIAAVEGGTGVGLRNVRDRLTARFGSAAACHWEARPEGGFTVTLTLPLVRHGC
ncbi:sensor histidine kinase [Novosphingobium terrae]|uniref:sensor histidine kinase n=1 Tax=Novosphingobium terrae TaxID=2726189 RepID=UPI001F12DC33|nr:histidine kinase [Novosphingobium terrae]